MESEIWGWIKSLIMDEGELKKGLENYLTRAKENYAPLYARLETIDKLIADDTQQLERLLDLYLAGEFPKDLLSERKTRIEKNINRLNQERSELSHNIEQKALTEQEIQDLLGFARTIREELSDVESQEDQRTKHRILELLGVTVILEVKDGEKLYHASCHLGDKPFGNDYNQQWFRTTRRSSSI